MENLIIECMQCGAEFEFSVDDQIRHRKMKFDDPKRCPECRKKKLRPPGFKNKKNNHRKKLDQVKYEY